ncbi:hypothetical protein OG216_09965 [Streptomycetaceae bacterium NBC_01309]
MPAAFPPMHGDPLLTRPLSAWSDRDWDEVAHLSELAAACEERGRSEEARYLAAAAAFRSKSTTTIPAARSAT